jgi:hypothetical protein
VQQSPTQIEGNRCLVRFLGVLTAPHLHVQSACHERQMPEFSKVHSTCATCKPMEKAWLQTSKVKSLNDYSP